MKVEKVDLEELKNFLDTYYGFDIFKRVRDRCVSYARRVFFKIAKDSGYRDVEIEKFSGFDSATIIYHLKKFSCLNDIDLKAHGVTMRKFNIKANYGESHFMSDDDIVEIAEVLNNLSRKEIRFVKNKLLPEFILKIEENKKLKKLYDESIS